MFKKLLCFIVICLVGISTLAFGEDVFDANISYTAETAEITIDGSYNGNVSVTIAPESLLPEDMSSAALPVAFKQIDADGTYSCSVGMPVWASGGRYKVYVASSDGEVSSVIVHINKVEAQNLVELLATMNGEEFCTLVLGNTLTLGIDDSDALFVQNQNGILAMLDDMQYSDAGEFGKVYAKAYALCAISGASVVDVNLYLQKYQTALGIDYVYDFNSDGRMNNNAKRQLAQLLSDIDYSRKINSDGDVDFKALFDKNKTLAAVQTSGSWLDLKQTITSDFADAFALMLKNANYSKVRDKDSVFEKMIGTEFTTISDIETAFAKACADVVAEESRYFASDSMVGNGKKPTAVTTPSSVGGDNTPKELFIDLPQEHWSYEAVSLLVANNIISGYTDGTFLPARAITRAEFAKMISALVNDEPTFEHITFADVSTDDWYYDCVTKASSLGLIKGDGKNYNPDSFIKREDAALIIYRLLVGMDKTPLGYKPFADRNDISDYAKDAVYALGGAGIVNGNGSNRFMPQSSLTRAETAQLIYNALYR